MEEEGLIEGDKGERRGRETSTREEKKEKKRKTGETLGAARR